MTKDVESFSVSSHQSILDAVMHHFYEMPRAGWAAMKVPFLGCRFCLLTSRRRIQRSTSRSKRAEDWIKMLDGIRGAANHQTITALQTPDTSAGSYIHIQDPFCSQLFGTPQIVDEI